MPFLGVQPTDTFASVAKQTITGDGSVTYTLTHSVAGANDLAVFVNNVRQEPTVAYSASGTSITFTEAIDSTDDCYVVYIARTFQTVTPPDNSINADQLSYPLTNFSSTGIDDNATSTAITVDSSERTSFSSSTNRPVSVVSTSTNSFVTFQDTNSASIGHVKIGSETNDMVFYANAQERMRIKAGNIGIGATDPSDAGLVVDAKGEANTSASARLKSNVDTYLRIARFGAGSDSTITIGSNYNRNGGSFSADNSSYPTHNITFHTDGSMRFGNGAAGSTAPTERMRILSGGGITFNGDTATANALDDYEEGTWTPRYEALTTDFSSVTYVVQDGFYQKVGNTLHTWFRLRISSYTGSPAGLVVVKGWPYTPSGGVYQAGTVAYSTGWTNSPQNVYTQTNQGYAILSKDGGAGTSGIQIGDMNASGFNDIICSLSYKV